MEGYRTIINGILYRLKTGCDWGDNSKGLEFQLSGRPGEQFSVKVSIQDHHVIEDFQV